MWTKDSWYALFDHLTDGVCVSDKDFGLLYANPAARRILNVGDRALEGVNVCMLSSLNLPTPGLGKCGIECPMRDRGEAAGSVDLEGVRVRCIRSAAEDGETLHLTLLEDNRREVEFRRQQEDWRNMVAHDLRTPLTPVLATLLMLQELPADAPLSDVERRLVEISIGSARRMLDLLNLYLDVVKLDAGLTEVKTEPVPLRALLEKAVAEQAALAQAKRIRISVDVRPEEVVQADPDLFLRVALNLINNAVKYTLAGGSLTITAARVSEGMVSVSFKDTGQGIRAEDLPHVFDRFYQARMRRAGNTQGTGLGLAFCKQAAESMGGRVYVVSEVGVGSEFSVQLPASPPEKPAQPAP